MLVVYLVALEVVALPIFALFFLDSGSGLLPLIPVLLLLDLGIAVSGALISSMATNSRARDLLAPLILLPLLIPPMIAAAGRGRTRCSPQAALPTTTSGSGWRCSVCTI